MWQCPHCGVPQAETARCWVCRRSSTTCSTCRHFRASVAADVGYCGLDRYRRPLTGLEERPCWEEGAASAMDAPVRAGTGNGMRADRKSARQRPAPYRADDGDRPPARDFVPIEQVGRSRIGPNAGTPMTTGDVSTDAAAASVPPPAFVLGDAAEGWEQPTTFFGDLER